MSTTAQRPRWLESRGADLISTRGNVHFCKSPTVELGGIEPRPSARERTRYDHSRLRA